MLNSKSIAIRIERVQEISQMDVSFGLNKEGKTETQEADLVKLQLPTSSHL